MTGLGPASEGQAGLSTWARAQVDPATAAKPGCSQRSQHPGRRGAAAERAPHGLLCSLHAGPDWKQHLKEVHAGRLVWEVDSGSGVGSGVVGPRAAPRAGGGVAHRPVLGGLELGHAHSFDMRHVKPSKKLYAAVQT